MERMIGETPRSEITRLLTAWGDGDSEALDQLMPLVYAELHEIAERYMHHEDRRHTLQPTALVNEVYLRLVDRRRVPWQNRLQFYTFTAQMMRRILVDYGRKRRAKKRGDGVRPLSLEEMGDLPDRWDEELIALDDALGKLTRIDQRQGKVVELRYFAGLTYGEIADELGISERTVKREWYTARLWLHRKLRVG